MAAYSTCFLIELSLTRSSEDFSCIPLSCVSFLWIWALACITAFLAVSSSACGLARSDSRAARVFGSEASRSRIALARWWRAWSSRRLSAAWAGAADIRCLQGHWFEGGRRRPGDDERSMNRGSRDVG